jgi:hypothetical protein
VAWCAVRACLTSTSPRPRLLAWPSNERSLAVRIELRDDEQTLTDERIDAGMQASVRGGGLNQLVRAFALDGVSGPWS